MTPTTPKIKWMAGGPPPLLQWRSSNGFIIATVCISLFTDFFLYGMIVPVMPSALVERAGIPYNERGYWVSILLMADAGAAALASPIFGYLLDISGSRQLPYLFGLVLLAASMGAFAVAKSLAVFVLARLLQGAATAMVFVAGLALVTDSVPLNSLGQTIGYLSSATLVGLMAGPFLGGLLYDNSGYCSVFYMSFGLLALDFFLRLAILEKKDADRWVLSKCVEIGSLVHECPSSDVELVKLRKGSGLAVFALLSEPRILISMWATIVRAILIAAFDATLPIFVSETFSWGPTGAGLIFLPYCTAAFFEPFFGYLSDTYGVRSVTFTSFLLLAPSVLLFRLVNESTTSHKILLCVLLASTGLLIDVSEPALFSETQHVLEDMEAAQPGIFGAPGAAIGQSFSLLMFAYFAGLFLGPMVGGMVYQSAGWNVMTIGLGFLTLASAVPCLLLSGKPILVVELESEVDEREPLVVRQG